MKNKIISELAREAGALVAETKDIAGEEIQGARKRLDLALERAAEIYGQVRESAADGTSAINELVHKNSYQAIAIGLGVGAALGYLLARGCSHCCSNRHNQEGG